MPLPGGTTNFGEVERFASLGEGKYEGHIEYVRFKDGSARGKSDQLSVCLVSDEQETEGEKTWQNLYFTPKSMGRMADFFAIFGIESVNWDTGLSDEDPFDLIDPDLSGEPVVFEVTRDPQDYKGKPSYKAEVIEWLGGKPAKPEPKAKPAAAKAAEADDTEDEDPPEAEAKPARRAFTPSKPAAEAAAPKRRSLR